MRQKAKIIPKVPIDPTRWPDAVKTGTGIVLVPTPDAVLVVVLVPAPDAVLAVVADTETTALLAAPVLRRNGVLSVVSEIVEGEV